MKSIILGLISLLLFNSCTSSVEEIPLVRLKTLEIKGCDLSFLPEIRSSEYIAKNRQGQNEDMLLTLKKEGVNTIRLRVWNNPSSVHSGLSEVKNFAQEIHEIGLKVLITVHYSDWWADPGSQTKPQEWNSLSYSALKDSVYEFTKRVITETNPEYIQIGNEINGGLLWDDGRISKLSQMVGLLQQGCKAVRDNSSSTKIIIHFAGFENAENFYTKISSLNYDIIGLSYYPLWHGKDLNALKTTVSKLVTTFNKSIFIAETAYPFTLGYNDWTNNVLGDATQIIDKYPATESGQLAFLLEIKSIMTAQSYGLGFCYWGGEYVAFKGNTAKDGSSFENMALWDFSSIALPAITVFND